MSEHTTGIGIERFKFSGLHTANIVNFVFMASEVYEIIQKLSLEVTGNDSLKVQIDALKKQSEAIDELSKKRDLLNKNIPKDPIPERAERAKKAVVELTAKIDAQTAALTKQVQQQQIVQRSAQQELGLIQKLTDKITDLQHARERQTDAAGVRQTTSEIGKLRRELADLTTEAKAAQSGGLLSSLFGIGSGSGAGKQVLQGLLGGLGIGVGFSIIPALTSSLIEFASAELDTIGNSKKLIDANRALESSFDSLGGELQKLLELQKTISVLGQDFAGRQGLEKFLYDQSTDGLKRQADAVKALGVVNGEVYNAEQNQLEAAQKLRRDELANINEKQQGLERILSILGPIQKASLQAGDLFTDISNVFSSDAPNGSNRAERDAVIERLRKSGLPFDIQQELVASAKTAQESGANIYDALLNVVKKYENEVIKTKQTGLDKQAEIDNANVQRQSKIAEELFELNKSLQERITANILSAKQQQTAIQSKYEDNVTALINLNEAERLAARKRIEKERQDAILKDGELGVEANNKFNQLKLQSDREYYRKQGEILDAANTRRIQAEKTARDIIVQSQVSTTGSIVSTSADDGIPNIVAIQANRNAIKRQQDIALAEQRNAAVDAARKEGVDVQNIELQFDQARAALRDRQRRDDINAELKYYSDLASIARERSEQILADFLAQGTRRDKAAQDFLNGDISGSRFRNNARRNFLDALDINNVQSGAIDGQIQQAQDALSSISGKPGASQADIDRAKKSLDDLIIKKNQLTNTKAELISSENIRQLNQALDLYNQLAQSAVQAYNTIADARNKDLDREISVREQRVSVALKLAERGNTEVLGLEQKRLKELQAERRKDALQQQAINSALAISYAAVAFAKALANPVSALATIAAGVALGATIFGAVKSFEASSKTGFFDGGYTGDKGTKEVAGVVHGREFVSTAETTAKYRPILEAMHDGTFPTMMPVSYARPGNYATKQEFASLESAIYSVADEVRNKETKNIQVMDQKGLYQASVQYSQRERNKYRN